MTSKETAQIVLAMAAAWPTLTVDEFRISVWATMLADIPPEIGVLALQQLMTQQHFPPSVHEFRKACWEIATPLKERLDEGQAWELVYNALSELLLDPSLGYKPLFGLPKEVLAICREIGLSSVVNDDLGYIRNTFLRLWREKSTKRVGQAVMPNQLKTAIAGMQAGNRPKLPPGTFGIVPAKEAKG